MCFVWGFTLREDCVEHHCLRVIYQCVQAYRHGPIDLGGELDCRGN